MRAAAWPGRARCCSVLGACAWPCLLLTAACTLLPTGDAEEDPYHFAGDLKGMLQATAPRQQAQPQPPSCRPVPPSEPELRASPLPDDECNYANQNDASEDWITTRELATFIEL